MSIANIPISELLRLWSELDDAYRGFNGFGGNTAQLYAFRFTRQSPLAESARELKRGQQELPPIYAEALQSEEREAAHALYDLLDRFSNERECRIEVDGREFGEWLLETPFGHRARVRVIQEARP